MPKYKRTYADRREYMIRAVAKRRHKIKVMAVKYKGGKCALCGYNNCVDALHFHHINPETKEFGLGLGGLTRAWLRVKKEADKCILICANCHSEVHAGVTQLPQVTAVEHGVNSGKPRGRSSYDKSKGNPEPILRRGVRKWAIHILNIASYQS